MHGGTMNDKHLYEKSSATARRLAGDIVNWRVAAAWAQASLVAGMLIVPLSCNAKGYLDFSGARCVGMELASSHFSYYEQSKFLPKNSAAASSALIQQRDWQVNDNYNAHLGPALSEMNSELGQGRGGSVSGNLHWTLVRMPNNPIALQAIVNYSFIIKKKPRHKPLINQPECYLEQALDYDKKKNATVRVIYGIYLYRLNMYEKALQQLDAAASLSPRSSEISYNRGLVLFKLERFDEARDAARKAYAAGYPLRGLRRMLQAKGLALSESADTAHK